MTFTLHLFNIQFLREMQSWRGNIDECSILRGQERPQGKFQIILSKVISIWFKKIICDDCISQRPIWVTFILFIIYFSFVFAMIEFKLRITLHWSVKLSKSHPFICCTSKFNSISKILLTSYVSYIILVSDASFIICSIIIMICIHRSVKRPLNFHVRCIRHNTYSEQFGRLHQAINQKVTA